MKRILYILMLVALGLSSASAQSEAADSLRIQKRAERRAELMQTHSQFRFSVGITPIFGSYIDPSSGMPGNSATPLYGLEYSYRVWNFLEVGVSLAMCGLKQPADISASSYVLNSGPIIRHAVSVNWSLTVRYSWFNRRWVSLYSSIGAWSEIAFYKPDASGRPDRYYGTLLPEIVPIGVRVGRRLFGFFEPICFSGRGILLQGGIGYKF